MDDQTTTSLRSASEVRARVPRHDASGIEITVIESVPSRLSELLLDGTLEIGLMAQMDPIHA